VMGCCARMTHSRHLLASRTARSGTPTVNLRPASSRHATFCALGADRWSSTVTGQESTVLAVPALASMTLRVVLVVGDGAAGCPPVVCCPLVCRRRAPTSRCNFSEQRNLRARGSPRQPQRQQLQQRRPNTRLGAPGSRRPRPRSPLHPVSPAGSQRGDPCRG
jgi:hypothetical protein